MVIEKGFFQKLSDICSDIGLVCFATLVVPLFGQGLKGSIAISGLLLTLIFWSIALWIANGIEEK